MGRLQYGELFTAAHPSHTPADIDGDVTYELLANGAVIYKSVIPSVFAISAPLSLTNLKQSISVPALTLSALCLIRCEPGNAEGDY